MNWKYPCFNFPFFPELIPSRSLYLSPAIASVYFPAECGFSFKASAGMRTPSSLLLPLFPHPVLYFPCPSSPKYWLAATLNGGFVCELPLFACLTLTEEEIQEREEAGKERKHWKVTCLDSFFWTNTAIKNSLFFCFYLCCGLFVLQ